MGKKFLKLVTYIHHHCLMHKSFDFIKYDDFIKYVVC